MPQLAQVDHYWGVRALDFVDAVETAKSPSEVMNLFNKSIAEAGFNAYVMVGLPDSVTAFPKRLMADGWPAGWSDLYVKENLCDVDPVAKHCMQTLDPFDWASAPVDLEREPKGRDVMRRAADFRMDHGFCVPIHYGNGAGAAVSIAGERPDFGRGVRSAMLLMALYAHHRVRGLLLPPKSTSSRVLTKREREVLSWTAAGKTSWEISCILGITERTANAHVAAAARKLKAVNRISTIVAALRTGEISL